MPFHTHDGVNLRYDRAGSGPPVLLVHGWTCNRTFWDRQVHALRDRCTLITVDVRGHGESSHPQKGYAIGALVGDLEALVRALRVPRIAVVGWSMGGMLSLELARRLGDKVSALALVCSSAGGLTDAKNPHAQTDRLAQMREALAKDFRAHVRSFAPLLFKAGAASPLLPWAVSQMQKTPPHVAQACLEMLATFDARPYLKKLEVPAAILHGRHDEIFPLAEGELLGKQMPKAKLTVFEDSGHAPHLEEAEQFNAALGTFLML